MINLNKRNKKAKPEVVAETPVTETKVEATPAITNGGEQEKANDTPPKVKKQKYAPAKDINNAAIIRVLVANPKKGKSRARFDVYKDGQTVAEFIQAMTDANKKGFARPDLRWDLQHGFIKLEAPAEKPEVKS